MLFLKIFKKYSKNIKDGQVKLGSRGLENRSIEEVK